MKTKVSAFCVFLLILFSASCKKETSSSIIGQWVNVADYFKQENGTFSWMPAGRYPYHFYFSSDGEFAFGSDVPAGSGTYNYDNRLENLILNYKADGYGNVARTQIFKVEGLTNNTLVISYFSSSGSLLYKTEYARIN